MRDWSQAQPLQCGYPATPPSVGDYLTVADPLPDPAQGTGRYYVTAVTHQGQRRYGRKATNGVLSGRDPASAAAVPVALRARYKVPRRRRSHHSLLHGMRLNTLFRSPVDPERNALAAAFEAALNSSQVAAWSLP